MPSVRRATLVDVERKGNVGELRSDDPQLANIKDYIAKASEVRKVSVLNTMRINEFTFPIYHETLASFSAAEIITKLILSAIENNKKLTDSQKDVLFHIGADSLFKHIEDSHETTMTQYTLYALNPTKTVALMADAISSGKINQKTVINSFMNFLKKRDAVAYSKLLVDLAPFLPSKSEP